MLPKLARYHLRYTSMKVIVFDTMLFYHILCDLSSGNLKKRYDTKKEITTPTKKFPYIMLKTSKSPPEKQQVSFFEVAVCLYC